MCPPTSNRCLNVSALAVLRIAEIEPFPGHMKLGLVLRQVEPLAIAVQRSVGQLVRQIGGTISGEIDRTWIRIPLDFHREDMKALQ